MTDHPERHRRAADVDGAATPTSPAVPWPLARRRRRARAGGASSLAETDLGAGDWVRAGLVAAWALAAIVLAVRGAPALGVVVAGAAVVGGRLRRHRALRRTSPRCTCWPRR